MKETIRKIIFLIFCIGARILLAYISKNLSEQNLKFSSFIGFCIGIMFIILYLFDFRKFGIEASNGIVWWNSFRPVHGILFILYAIYAYKGEKKAYYILLIDASLGLLIWINKQLKINTLYTL